MRERILLMGPPSSGKSTQLINIYLALRDEGTEMALIDLEDKLEATLLSSGIPLPKSFFSPLSWEEYTEVVDKLLKEKQAWIGVDRVDLTWNMVQRWFTRQRYNEELSKRMLEKSKEMKKTSMFIPRFDQGSWQVINEAYESTMFKLLYASRCNVIMTAGIRGLDEDNPIDTFARLGVAPRGQKELSHQPHSVFLLFQKAKGKEVTSNITTAKD